MFGKVSAVGCFAFFFAGILSAEENGLKLAPLRAMASWEASEIESFVGDPTSTPSGKLRELSSASSIWLLQEARLSERAKLFVGVGGFYFFVLPSDGNQYSIGQRSAFGFTDLHGEFEFWSRGEADHGLLLKAGVFPFKYNQDAKNLGEYMFRTYTYPTIIMTGGLQKVNSAGVQLNGFDANTKIAGLTNDLLLTIKTDQVPSASLSLTDMLSYTIMDVLTLGAGVMWDNFYDPSKIAEGKYDNKDLDLYYTLANGTKKLKAPQNPTDAAFDPTVDVAVDTSRLTFVGHKAMFRASLDIGKIISLPILSEKDLRLYFECILLGIKNQPFYYTKMKDRIAYMYGFNLPTFRAVDLLSVEAEYCQNPYPDNSTNATGDLSPTPLPSGKKERGDDFKWTVYAKKTIYSSFAISGQVANDHLRLVDYFGHTNDSAVMPRRKDWYWALQLGYSI